MTEQSKDVRNRVLHVDDDESWRGIVSRNLTGAGIPNSSLETFEQGEEAISQGLLGVAVAIFDGNLKPGNGAELARLLKVASLPVAIIGLSTEPTPWADVSFIKGSYDPDKLRTEVETLISIFHPTRQSE